MTRRNEGVAAWHTGVHWGSRWGDSAYERGADARRKFWIKPLKETDLGEAQAFFDPYKRPKIFAYQMIPKAKIYTPKRDDEHPHPFHMPSSPPPPHGLGIHMIIGIAFSVWLFCLSWIFFVRVLDASTLCRME